ncbi:MAG TPA: DUF6807 family protein, partial [Planctomycetota bacterium]|nr:DUF6807 family protein [Planctomycetota bacterium]
MLPLLLAVLAPQQVVVDPGPRDRFHVPVRVALPPDAPTREAVLVDAQGGRVPAQVVAEGDVRVLVAVVPSLKAGTPSTFKLAWESPGAGAFRWHDTKGEHLELRHGERPVLRYMYAPLDESSKEARERTYKPFHHVFDPAGTRLLTKGAGGQYTHHRGIYYGFNKVTYGDGRKADVWHCGGQAHQLHEAVLQTDEGPVLGRHRVA